MILMLESYNSQPTKCRQDFINIHYYIFFWVICIWKTTYAAFDDFKYFGRFRMKGCIYTSWIIIAPIEFPLISTLEILLVASLWYEDFPLRMIPVNWQHWPLVTTRDKYSSCSTSFLLIWLTFHNYIPGQLSNLFISTILNWNICDLWTNVFYLFSVERFCFKNIYHH